jgi:asparagine synthase (glutamine-hydrolysing)
MFFWMPLLERVAADGTKVLLDGEGGDEVYGVSAYLIADRLARGRVRGAADVVRGLPGADRGLSRKEIRSWLLSYGAAGLVPAWAHDIHARVRPAPGPVGWMTPATRQAWRDTHEPGGWKRFDGPRYWAWQVYATTRMGASLAYEHIRHRASLAGTMSRHPLIDVDVHELVLSLPPELTLESRYSRPLLREAVKGRLPDAVRLRPSKSTFDQVFHDALAGPELPVARALLGPGARVAPYVDLGAIQRDLLEPGPPEGFYGRQFWALQVWRLMTAECFLRGLEDRDGPRKAIAAVAPPPPDVEVVSGGLQR